MEQSEQHGSIPAPPDFPVTWENPDDEHLFWTRDVMHFPDQMNELEGELAIRVAQTHGFARASETYEMPIRLQPRRINTYYYTAVVPVMAPPDEMKAMEERAREKLGEAMVRLGETWSEDYLPEIQQYLKDWDDFDLRGAPMPELLAHLDETLAKLQRLWEIHFAIAFPMLIAISTFEEFYRDLFNSEDAFDAYRLLQGLDNKTVESGRMLWRLSRQALEMPEVRKILEEGDAADVVPALEGSVEGQEFLAEFDAYLDEYGHRGDKWGVSYPTWAENPTPVVKMLKDYITQSGGPDEELAALTAERERHLAETRELLGGYPQAMRDQFEILLKAAEEGTVLSEDHGFWIDFNSTARVRKVFVEFGRRFAEARVVEDPGDVFHLTLDEISETAEQLPNLGRRNLVAQRKAEIERFGRMQPPPALGTPPPGPPPDNPVNRSMSKFFGGPPQPPAQAGVLRGNPGSPGIVHGCARVLRALPEGNDGLEEGDILVAETTAPPWTPLFATAAGVVTDTGGILSHCAVVAREYRIPAVVGAAMATATIKDGQTIEVDGDKGIVRILSEDES